MEIYRKFIINWTSYLSVCALNIPRIQNMFFLLSELNLEHFFLQQTTHMLEQKLPCVVTLLFVFSQMLIATADTFG